MDNNKYNIIGIGEILWDIYENNKKYLGGAPANFAIHCAQLGNNGFIASRIGKDELGSEIKKSLVDRNISTDYLQIDSEKKTGTVKITLDKFHKPHFNCTSDVAFDYLQSENNLFQLATKVDGILFGTLAQRNKITRNTIQTFLAQASHAFKIYDINLRSWNEKIEKIVFSSFTLCDAIKLNDSELSILRKAVKPDLDEISFLKFLIKKYDLKLAALTRGKNGCLLLNKNSLVVTNGIKTPTVDTTGCGDAFAAGLMHQYLAGKSLTEISQFSNYLGAFVTQFIGATPVYSWKDLFDFRQTNI